VKPKPLVLIALFLMFPIYGCAGSSSSSPPTSQAAHTKATKTKKKHHAQPRTAVKAQNPAPVENNPPGDIPDNTAFLPYKSKGGRFSIKVPEGWARRSGASSVSFSSKLNVISATWKKASRPPSISRAKSQDTQALKRSVPAFQPSGVNKVSLPGGNAVLITYRANSKQNPVTGKRYRLVIERFEFYKSGREVDLNLSSPVGADNVDPWRLVSQSFRWN
jgi:hypothetical protein